MRTSRSLPATRFATAAFLCALALVPRNASGQSPKPDPAAQQAAADPSRLLDTELLLGAFDIGAHKYTVLAHEKSLVHSNDAKFGATLAELEIRGTNGGVVYRKPFPYDVQDGRFARTISATASMFGGAGGAALVVRYLEEPAVPGKGESWQLFGLVNGKLTPFGAPLPPGQGDSIAVGNVVTGVMVGNGVNVMPLASKAEALEFRAWTGNFFVYVPVRVDWEHGQWGEGEQCFALNGGTLSKTGCNMRIEAAPHADAEGLVVTVYNDPVEDRFHAQQVAVASGTTFEILAARAIVNWTNAGDRISCTFEDEWLRVRVHGAEGWVHSQPDFVALGLPATAPPE